jgi:hypothetical protein
MVNRSVSSRKTGVSVTRARALDITSLKRPLTTEELPVWGRISKVADSAGSWEGGPTETEKRKTKSTYTYCIAHTVNLSSLAIS